MTILQVDKLIDLAAPPPRGTGVENIRECIIESKMTFDVSSDDWQAYLKAKIMNNIERYFYLIVFAMYIRELGPKGFPQTFKQFMDDHSGEIDMLHVSCYSYNDMFLSRSAHHDRGGPWQA